MLTPFSRLLRRSRGADDRNAVGDSRRAYQRAAVVGEITVLMEDQRLSGKLLDVSITGAQLMLDRKLTIGGRLTLYLDRLDTPVGATVMRHTRSGMGIRFDDPSLGMLVAGWARGTSGLPRSAAGN